MIIQVEVRIYMCGKDFKGMEGKCVYVSERDNIEAKEFILNMYA